MTQQLLRGEIDRAIDAYLAHLTVERGLATNSLAARSEEHTSELQSP